MSADRYAPPPAVMQHSHTNVPYRLVVPSRKRTDKMDRILHLLPGATICVDESEERAYRPFVGDRLWLHPPLSGLPSIRQWILDHAPEHAVIFVDDDLHHVNCQVGRRKRTIPAGPPIIAVLENTLQLAVDLGLSLFCYTRQGKPHFLNTHDPFGLVAAAGSVLGIVGRKLSFDTAMVSRGDLDFTMRALLEDRIVLQDRRFYWDVGLIWGGKGGSQGVRTSDNEAVDNARMKARWGRFLNTSAGMTDRGTPVPHIAVPRKWSGVAKGS